MKIISLVILGFMGVGCGGVFQPSPTQEAYRSGGQLLPPFARYDQIPIPLDPLMVQDNKFRGLGVTLNIEDGPHARKEGDAPISVTYYFTENYCIVDDFSPQGEILGRERRPAGAARASEDPVYAQQAIASGRYSRYKYPRGLSPLAARNISLGFPVNLESNQNRLPSLSWFKSRYPNYIHGKSDESGAIYYTFFNVKGCKELEVKVSHGSIEKVSQITFKGISDGENIKLGSGNIWKNFRYWDGVPFGFEYRIRDKEALLNIY